MRFRRTIAWFVYRLPHGLIALGHQYGHINLAPTARYGNRIRSGLSEVMEEHAFALRDHLERAAAALDALCHPDNDRLPGIERSPDLTRCDPACPNITRTGTHMDGIREKMRQIDGEIASPATPEPLRVRLTQRRDKMQAILDAHARNRVVPSRQVL